MAKSHVFGLAVLIAVFSLAVEAKIPSYIKVCKRSDPQIDQCIINSINELRPKLIKGIPELEIPPLEPLNLPKISISRGGGLAAEGTDVTVRGASEFDIKSLKADVVNLVYVAEITIPVLTFNANYMVNAKILSINLKGKGPIYANATDVEGKVILKGQKVTEKGRTFVRFTSFDLKLKIKNYNVRLENLFNGDKSLGEAVNVALNENKRELMNLLRPTAEQVVSEVFLNIANKISEHFEYDELFPL